jgi:hypothetical protein
MLHHVVGLTVPEISKDCSAFILSTQHIYVMHLISYVATLHGLLDTEGAGTMILIQQHNVTPQKTKDFNLQLMYCAIYLTIY